MATMKNLILVCSLVLCSVLLSAQAKTPPPPFPQPVPQMQRDIKDLRAEITRLQEQITNLEFRVRLADVVIRDKQDRRQDIHLDPTSPGFLRLEPQ
jgi:hypothetical protein